MDTQKKEPENFVPFAEIRCDDQTDVVVDLAEKRRGNIKAIHGVNGGPLCYNGQVDLSGYFSDVCFPTVRLHDIPQSRMGVVDVPCLFPLFHLDHNDPQNYKFLKTDDYLKLILKCGSQIVYRLGVSIESSLYYDTDPPSDYSKWAEICINIIRHYNEGWADGFHFNIQCWEIWNEPENGPGMWNGDYESFVDFYVTVATHIKSAFPNIKIGGPANNGGMLLNRQIMHRFLPKLKETDTPLDFFSWHAYPERPGQLVTAAQEVRSILDEYGFMHTESHLNEWNLAPYNGNWSTCQDPHTNKSYIRRKKGLEGASLAASVLIALQDTPVDMSNFYNASLLNFGMFHFDGEPAKPYFAFKAFSMLCAKTPIRLAVNGSEPDEGIAVLAGISEDEKVINLLVSNFQSAKIKHVIELRNAPKSPLNITTRILDETRNLEEERIELSITDDGKLFVDVPPRAVRFLQIKLNSYF